MQLIHSCDIIKGILKRRVFRRTIDWRLDEWLENIPTKQIKVFVFALAFLILIFAVLSFVIVAGRLLYLQVINTNFYQSKAAENQTKDLIITPMRGSIYDRNMTELAVSATTQEISVSPTNIRTKGLASVEIKRDEKGKAIPATDEEKEAACLKYQQRLPSCLPSIWIWIMTKP